MTGDGPCACLWHFVYVNVCVICVQVYVCSRLYTCARVGTYIRISVLNVRVYHICTAKLIYPTRQARAYGVATISSLLKIIGLFCKRAL